MTGHDWLDRHRRRARRQAAIRHAAANCAYTIGYALMTAAAVVLLWIYGP